MNHSTVAVPRSALPSGEGRPLIDSVIEVGPRPDTPEYRFAEAWEAGVTRLFDVEQTPVEERAAAIAGFAREMVATAPARLVDDLVEGAPVRRTRAESALHSARASIEDATDTYGRRRPALSFSEQTAEDMRWEPPQGYSDERHLKHLAGAKARTERALQEAEVAGAVDGYIRRYRASGLAGRTATALEKYRVSIPLLLIPPATVIGGYFITQHGKRSARLMQITAAQKVARDQIAQEQANPNKSSS